MTHWRNRFEAPRYANDLVFGAVVFTIAFAIFLVLLMMVPTRHHRATFNERWAPANTLHPAIYLPDRPTIKGDRGPCINRYPRCVLT